jgi:hypothetical protein
MSDGEDARRNSEIQRSGSLRAAVEDVATLLEHSRQVDANALHVRGQRKKALGVFADATGSSSRRGTRLF